MGQVVQVKKAAPDTGKRPYNSKQREDRIKVLRGWALKSGDEGFTLAQAMPDLMCAGGICAKSTGTVRPTVMRLLAQMKRDGLVTMQGGRGHSSRTGGETRYIATAKLRVLYKPAPPLE